MRPLKCTRCGKMKDLYTRCKCRKRYCWECVYARFRLLPKPKSGRMYSVCVDCGRSAVRLYAAHAPLEELPLLMAYEMEEAIMQIIKDRLAGKRT